MGKNETITKSETEKEQEIDSSWNQVTSNKKDKPKQKQKVRNISPSKFNKFKNKSLVKNSKPVKSIKPTKVQENTTIDKKVQENEKVDQKQDSKDTTDEPKIENKTKTPLENAWTVRQLQRDLKEVDVYCSKEQTEKKSEIQSEKNVEKQKDVKIEQKIETTKEKQTETTNSNKNTKIEQ